MATALSNIIARTKNQSPTWTVAGGTGVGVGVGVAAMVTVGVGEGVGVSVGAAVGGTTVTRH
jgi:hypothetical protein